MLLLNVCVLWTAVVFQPLHSHGFLGQEDALAMFPSIMRLEQLPSWKELTQYMNFHKHISSGGTNGLLVQTIDGGETMKINVFEVAYDEHTMYLMDCFWDKNTNNHMHSFLLLMSWYQTRFPDQDLVMVSNHTAETTEWDDAVHFYSEWW